LPSETAASSPISISDFQAGKIEDIISTKESLAHPGQCAGQGCPQANEDFSLD